MQYVVGHDADRSANQYCQLLGQLAGRDRFAQCEPQENARARELEDLGPSDRADHDDPRRASPQYVRSTNETPARVEIGSSRRIGLPPHTGRGYRASPGQRGAAPYTSPGGRLAKLMRLPRPLIVPWRWRLVVGAGVLIGL